MKFPKRCENCANRNGDECKILRTTSPRKKYCGFMATQSEINASKRKADARLASLSASEQNSIAETYYDGFKPWLEAN